MWNNCVKLQAVKPNGVNVAAGNEKNEVKTPELLSVYNVGGNKHNMYRSEVFRDIRRHCTSVEPHCVEIM